MKNVPAFLLHSVIAMVLSIIPGGIISGVIGPLFGRVGPHYWAVYELFTDVPYSPLLWGFAIASGFLINRRTSRRVACWVWAAGLCWMALWIADSIRTHHLGSCLGCSVAQELWRTFFTVGCNSCEQEGLGELFATTPMLNSVAYSVGAFLAIKSARTGNSIVN